MKNLFLIATAIALFTVVTTSCKKDTSQTQAPQSTTSDDLIAKNAVNRIYKDTVTHIVPNKGTKHSTNSIWGGTVLDGKIYAYVTYKGNGNYYLTYYIDGYGDELQDLYLQRTDIPNGPKYEFFMGLVDSHPSFTNELTIQLPPGNYRILGVYSDSHITGPVTLQSDYFTIYARPVPPSGRYCLYRYENRSNGHHFTTNDWEELGSTSQGFYFEGVTGYVNTTSGVGTTALYRYYNSSANDHYYSVGGTPSGYNLEGIVGYVGTNAIGTLTEPLISYYYGNEWDHMLASADETVTNTNYAREGIVGYAQRNTQPKLPVDGTFVRNSDTGEIYMFFEGALRYIPTGAVLNGLFVYDPSMLINYTSADIASLIPVGIPFSTDIGVVNDSITNMAYLREGNTIRWISSTAIKDLYHFNWANIQAVNGISAYTLGSPINN